MPLLVDRPPSSVGSRRRRSSGRSAIWIWLGLPAIVLICLAFLTPLVLMAYRSFGSPLFGHYSDALDSVIFRRSIVPTVRMAAVVTIGSILVAYPYAYVLARSGRTMRIVLMSCMMLSYWTGTLIRTYAWQIILNDTGLINRALIDLGLIDNPLHIIRTEIAVDIGMIQILAPMAILTIFAQMIAISSDLELAARSMGARRWQTFLRITVPLTRPGAAAGGVLVFVLSLGFYITPQILGGQRTPYAGSAIAQEVSEFLAFDTGSAMSVLLVVVTLAVIAITIRFTGISRVLGITDRSPR